MKIPFDIKYRPQIESGEYRVETREGLPVRIICWDRRAKRPNDDDVNLCVLIPDDGGEAVYYYHRAGKRWVPNDDYDLFIVTPEEELTNFEKGLNTFLQDYVYTTVKAYAPEYIKKNSGVLLSLAREQFIKDGYVIEKKAFHDAVEKVDSEVMKEVSDKVDMEETLRLEYEKGKADALKEIEQDPESSYAFKRGVEYGKEEAEKYVLNDPEYLLKAVRLKHPKTFDAFIFEDMSRAMNLGKAEALKDLPRWKKCEHEMHTLTNLLIRSIDAMWIGAYVKEGQYYIPTNDLLLKLPGFKED